ncbi:hypothetical protein EVAR_26649_1 [Eumeta japonica]|uniref:Uncharacterized protein n=1 Tax=Eumeta variegata TaxID=151549 RepID=A0A4C1VMH8_EUMVA|nr:hypothetical protein EVAR_26649_1 [Eumeta japonica]
MPLRRQHGLSADVTSTGKRSNVAEKGTSSKQLHRRYGRNPRESIWYYELMENNEHDLRRSAVRLSRPRRRRPEYNYRPAGALNYNEEEHLDRQAQIGRLFVCNITLPSWYACRVRLRINLANCGRSPLHYTMTMRGHNRKKIYLKGYISVRCAACAVAGPLDRVFLSDFAGKAGGGGGARRAARPTECDLTWQRLTHFG